jgi:hypothetical protein
VGFLAPAGGRLAIRPISDARQDVAVSGVAVGGGLVWAYGSFFNPASSPGQSETGVVTAIDPRTGTIVRQLRLAGPASPAAVVITCASSSDGQTTGMPRSRHTINPSAALPTRTA